MYELVIRNGKVVDGTGGPSRVADVAVRGDRIVAVGENLGPGEREIDASGKLVTPGWVDIHTHYDGQATWDPHVTPSSWHGVTSVVMGNCGVGFAPAHPERHDWLIQLMEGVEDIPGSALAEGIEWQWETFPEYLDALEKIPRSIDIGAQVPHGAVRAYVMDERGARNEKASEEDIEKMAAIVREAIEAGALGFSTSRTFLHRAKDGEPVPGSFASADELIGIGHALGEAGSGVFECASDLTDESAEIAWMHTISKETGRPVTFACLQGDHDPKQWKRLLAACEASAADGGRVTPQVAARPAGILMGLESTIHPFIVKRAYREIADLPLEERVARMREPAVRAAIVDDTEAVASPMVRLMTEAFHKLFPLGTPPDYEPGPEKSVAAIAKREGRRPAEVAYDMMLQQEGRELLYFPILGYAEGDLEDMRSMMMHPQSVFGLSDGGAHCATICDASIPTYLLTHWGRDRKRGARIPVEKLVSAQSRETAALYELNDRGIIAPGMKADINVIDFEALQIHMPEMVRDLPAGAGRLLQGADGYDYTICSGEVIFESGIATGAMPGRLIRGPQKGPESETRSD
ncbi:MAG: amidohydrolase family protein [Myxococcota bacterium]|nr:amidohydrolase family protein [Myxococcota bacterium]